jgi:hypothetical protein
MLVRIFLIIGLFGLSAQANTTSDLGDVVICPGQGPVARFNYQSKDQMQKTMNVTDVLQKIALINSNFAKNISEKIQLFDSQIRFKSSTLTNRDGSALGECQLDQLYKIHSDMIGSKFVIVNQDLYQKLSQTEQSVFLIEIYIQLFNENLIITPSAAIEILSYEQALASDRSFAKNQWYKFLPRSWETCFIPIAEFGTQLCFGIEFNSDTMTGATYPYLGFGQQEISILNQKIKFEQLNTKNGVIEFIYWYSLNHSNSLWIQNSLVYPSVINFNPDQTIESIGILSRVKNSIICKNQNLILNGGGLYHFNFNTGCLIGEITFNRDTVGEIVDQKGRWHNVQSQSVILDNEGYLQP